MPGVGHSPATHLPYAPWMVSRWTQQILDRLGLDQIDVVGLSWGGAVAQQFTAQYRDRVRHLILCATSLGVTMVPGIPASLSRLSDARAYSDPDIMRENFVRLYSRACDPEAEKFTRNLIMPHPLGLSYQVLAFMGWSSLPIAHLLDAPTLVLLGGKDIIVPPSNGHLFKQAIPHAELFTIPDAKHLFFVSRAKEVSKIIQQFSDDHALAGQTPSNFSASLPAAP